MSKVKTVSLYLMGLFYILVGILHFIVPEGFMKIMPPYINQDWHRPLVFISGLVEIGLGVLVLVPRYRVLAAWGIILLLIAVFPANVYMAQAYEEIGVSAAVAYGRLPVQALFLLWAWWYTRGDNNTKTNAKPKRKTPKR